MAHKGNKAAQKARSYQRKKARAAGAEGSPEQQEAARDWFTRRIAKKRESRRAAPEKVAAEKARYYERNRDRLIQHIGGRYKDKQELSAGRPRPDRCEICSCESYNGGAIHWDHDHATGAFRGWLCARCNHTLGKVKDDPELLWKLAAYLEAPYGPGPLAAG